MLRFKRYCAALTAALCLSFVFSPAVPAAEASALVSIAQPDADADARSQKPSANAKQSQNKDLIEQIRDTYAAAKKRARVRSFKGRCGSYVNHQLVVRGINTKYIGANGNREYDIYCKKSESSGGYAIHAFGAKKYTLKSALRAIEKLDPNARNILVGFQRGTSSAGRRYGHALFIHGIENGMVYFSDSYAQKVNGVRCKEGAPIVCSIDTFANLYKRYKLDGVIWFS